MRTGYHLVRDVSCKKCGLILGWLYEMALEESQRCKENKIVLEISRLKEHDGIDEERPGPSRKRT